MDRWAHGEPGEEQTARMNRAGKVACHSFCKWYLQKSARSSSSSNRHRSLFRFSLQEILSSARDRARCFDLDVESSIVVRFRFPSELQDFAIAPLDDPGPAPLGYLDYGDGHGCG